MQGKIARFFDSVRQHVDAHRFLIGLCFLVLFSSVILNFFVGRHRAFLTGEYVFSFDYASHLENLRSEMQSRDPALTNNQACDHCLLFYHYSRWYSLFKLGNYALGEFLGFNPFVYFLTFGTILQLVSLYIFVKTFFTKFHYLAYLFASILFISFPIRIVLIGESNEGVTYSLFLLFFACLKYVFDHIDMFSYQKISVWGLIFGLIVSFFFNISISHLPLFIYVYIGAISYFFCIKWANLKKIIYFFMLAGLVPILINIPLIWSILQFKRDKFFYNFHSFTPLDSFSLFLPYSGAPSNFAVVFLLVLAYFFVISRFIGRRVKIFLLVSFLFLSVLIMGTTAPLNIYGWIFENVFLMDSIRATHKFLIFQLIIVICIVYDGLLTLFDKNKFSSTVLALIFGISLFLLPLSYLSEHKSDIGIVKVPADYWDVKNYFQNNDDKKLYLPYSLGFNQNLTGNYTWSGKTLPLYLYSNPFTSLFFIKNLVTFERMPYTIQTSQKRALASTFQPLMEFINGLQTTGIKHLIVDEHYFHLPYTISEIRQQLPLEKQFGSIYIFEIPSGDSCIASYGDFRNGYCVGLESDTPVLIRRTPLTFALDRVVNQTGSQRVTPNPSARLPGMITDPHTQELIAQEKIYVPSNFVTIDTKKTPLFIINDFKQADYVFAFPLLYLPEDESQFPASSLVVRVNNTVTKEINLHRAKATYDWAIIDVPSESLDNENTLSVTLDYTGYRGFAVSGTGLLFTDEEWDHLLQNVDLHYSKLELID